MALNLDIKTPNLTQKIQQLGKLGSAQRKALAVQLGRLLLGVLADSKKKYPRVPVDTGALQSTGHVNPPKIDFSGVQAYIAYGGVAGPPYNKTVDYAVVTHDDLSRKGKFQRPRADPKYVETHLNKRDIDSELVEALDIATKKTMT